MTAEPTPPTASHRPPKLPWWALALVLAWGPGIVAFGVASDEMGDRRPVVLAGAAVVLSAAAWLAAMSLARHLAAADAQRDRPYVVRHRGLVFAAPMWSTMTTLAVRTSIARDVDPGFTGVAFDALALATIHAPIWLWSGGLWQRMFDAGTRPTSGRGPDGR